MPKSKSAKKMTKGQMFKAVMTAKPMKKMPKSGKAKKGQKYGKMGTGHAR
jgi:hypothetical protein